MHLAHADSGLDITLYRIPKLSLGDFRGFPFCQNVQIDALCREHAITVTVEITAEVPVPGG